MWFRNKKPGSCSLLFRPNNDKQLKQKKDKECKICWCVCHMHVIECHCENDETAGNCLSGKSLCTSPCSSSHLLLDNASVVMRRANQFHRSSPLRSVLSSRSSASTSDRHIWCRSLATTSIQRVRGAPWGRRADLGSKWKIAYVGCSGWVFWHARTSANDVVLPSGTWGAVGCVPGVRCWRLCLAIISS